MTWVRLDDAFSEHPKIARLSDTAFALWVTSLAYANRNLTDGFVPTNVGQGQLRYCNGNATPAIAELEGAGLWEQVDGGWRIHDFLDFQPSRDDVEREREQKRAAGAAGGRATAVARAAAAAVAESQPVPVPVPVPTPQPQDQTPSRAAARRRSYPAAFDAFWKAYPEEGRRDKPKALAAFERAVQRLVGEGHSQTHAVVMIVDAAKRYAADPNRDPEHTKWAQGWLTGDRWNDDPLPSRNGPTPGARSHALAQQMRGSP